MGATGEPGGALELSSPGGPLGADGAYVVVEHEGRNHASRAPIHETFRVYVDAEGVLRADHGLRLWSYPARMHLEFSGEVWWWRGPAPYHFVTVPEEESAELQAASAFVTYGWGMIPVEVVIGSTTWATSLWPKDGGYVVPLKSLVRKAEQIDVGDVVTVTLAIGV